MYCLMMDTTNSEASSTELAAPVGSARRRIGLLLGAGLLLLTIVAPVPAGMSLSAWIKSGRSIPRALGLLML